MLEPETCRIFSFVTAELTCISDGSLAVTCNETSYKVCQLVAAVGMSVTESCEADYLFPVLCFKITLWRGRVTAGRGWWRPVGGKIVKERFSTQETGYLCHTATSIHAASLQWIKQ